MDFIHRSLTVLAGLVAAQAAVGQGLPGAPLGGVSMRVVTRDHDKGYMCERFQCTPHEVLADAGERVLFEMYGLAGEPYILFAGAQAKTCYGLPWLQGGIAVDLPMLIVEVGQIEWAGNPSACGLHVAATKVQIPDAAAGGAQLVFQASAWSNVDGEVGVSRPTKLTVKAIN